MQLIEDYYQKKNSKKRLKKCLKDAEKERVKLQNSLIIKIKQLLSPHLLSCECKNNLFINDCISLIFCKNRKFFNPKRLFRISSNRILRIRGKNKTLNCNFKSGCINSLKNEG